MTVTLRTGGVPGVARTVAHALVLVSVAAGTTTITAMHKTVTIEVDGDQRTVSAFGRTVEDVLAGHRVEVAADDQVFPSVQSSVSDGDLIVVRTVRMVEVEIDGEVQTIASTALTVGEMLEELGPRTRGAAVSASRSDALGRDRLRISTLKEVSVAIDGGTSSMETAAGTVREVLESAGVVLNPGDVVDPALDSVPVDGGVITVGRAASSTDTTTEALPFEVEEVEDPTLVVGQRVVSQTGRVGQAVTTYDVTLVDGVETARTVLAQQVTVSPRNEVVKVGTLDLPDPSTVVVDPGSARALGQSMVLERGWGAEQFTCLDSLWTKESNWKVTAENASSGAYGIPQSLPGTKMASVADDWRTNAATQITWGLGYIEGRYGTPCAAWAHSQQKNWY
ncbi:ubiquitin-like domain-containing protein [Sanguibacter suaedae]|uniref:aggregation-promoting factor C-terminal-like domain-containing protein n=1 Tax=Sanguibacter suaedae TaxID=2795737 RepID=UPI0027DD05A2|nr:ubiquitin-like domain-containing protein [Sanguibacter suaedae]